MLDALQWLRENAEWLIVAGGVALASLAAFAASKASARRKPSARRPESAQAIQSKFPPASVSFESSRKASLYRAKNKAYLMVHALIANDGGEPVVIRAIAATMGSEKGVMAHEKFTALASHLGRESSFSFGSSENLLPLSLAPGASRDAYLCFAFSSADAKPGNVALEIFTSKGRSVLPLEVEVVG